mgnify:CR=1 FL=1|tara:strand:- start:189 stop:572 length:384 start_codon:yes stop_codon:yes gene_type:complete
MAIRIDLCQDQDVEVTATFEVCDEEPDGVTADHAEDILELMDNSNITMAEVIEAAVLNGVDMPEAHSVTFDLVMAFLDGRGAEGDQYIKIISSALVGLRLGFEQIERANIQLRQTIDNMDAAEQKTA